MMTPDRGRQTPQRGCSRPSATRQQTGSRLDFPDATMDDAYAVQAAW